MKKEVRTYTMELRADDSNIIEGYAIVFNKESRDLGGFVEVIDPNAISPSLLSSSDIKLYYDHDSSRGLLARYRGDHDKNSLEIEIDQTGMYFMTTTPVTSLGQEVREGIKRGDLDGCSFAFTVAKDKWEKREDGKYLRTVLEIDGLYDLSVVQDPAYLDTSVACRAFDKIKEEDKLSAYFSTMRNRINKH